MSDRGFDDEFEDARTANALRELGDAVRRGDAEVVPQLAPPPDLAKKLQAAALREDKARSDAPVSRRWWMLAAAALVLAAGIWAVLSKGFESAPAPQLSLAMLSSVPGVERSHGETSFKSGDTVHVLCASERDGTGFLTMLDSAGVFGPVLDERGQAHAAAIPRQLSALWSVELDDQPGREAFVVLVAAPGADAAFFEDRVRVAAAALQRERPADFDSALELVLRELQGEPSLSTCALPFEHSAR